jgi:hypothetical protein
VQNAPSMSPNSSAKVNVHIPAILGVGATVLMSEALVDNLYDVRGTDTVVLARFLDQSVLSTYIKRAIPAELLSRNVGSGDGSSPTIGTVVGL